MTETGGIWLFLEKYKELTTNGLDLLSFCLMTPQFVRVTQPVIAVIVLSLLFSIVMLVMSTVGLAIGFIIDTVYGGQTPEGWRAAVLLLAALFLMVLISVLTGLALRRISERVSLGALTIGVVLFVLSRMLAFMIAVHQV